MPSTGRGATGSPGGGGSSTSSQLPPVSRSPLPRTRPSTTTLPASASSAAAVRVSPNSRDRAWSTRCPSRPSGTGRARLVPDEGRPGTLVTAPIVNAATDGTGQRGPGPPGANPSGALGGRSGTLPGAVEVDASQRQERAEDAAADDR